MKLGEVVVPMDTTTSPSFIKIGLKTKKFSHEPISGTFECGVNNRTVEVHHLNVSKRKSLRKSPNVSDS